MSGLGLVVCTVWGGLHCNVESVRPDKVQNLPTHIPMLLGFPWGCGMRAELCYRY